MNSRLKNLYKYLIENRKHEMEGWHEAYTRFYGKVEEIRNRIIKNREEGLSQNNDEDFLLYNSFTIKSFCEKQNCSVSNRPVLLCDQLYDYMRFPWSQSIWLMPKPISVNCWTR